MKLHYFCSKSPILSSLHAILGLGLTGAIFSANDAKAALIPILEYQFNDTGTTTASTGSDTTSLTFKKSANVATDLHGAGGSGVSGAAGDFAFDNRTTPSMGGAGGVASSGTGTDLEGVDTFKSFTLAGWFKTDSAAQIGVNARLIDNFNGASNAGFHLFAGSNGTLTLQIGNGTSTASYLSTASAYSATQTWVFFAVTVTGTGTVNFYNGNTTTNVSLVNSVTGTAAVQSNNTTPFSIGNRDTTDRSFDGLLDNIRVYGSDSLSDAVLSLSELESLRIADVTSVPEPSAYALLGGLMALSCAGLRRRRA